MNESLNYTNKIPDLEEFELVRNDWRYKLSEDLELRKKAIDLIIESSKYNYGYQWEWCGVPIIRRPDDIVLQQEIMWKFRPECVIETGVARGGSLVLSSTLLEINNSVSRVLGLDIKILPHTFSSIKNWIDSGKIEVFEVDSTSFEAKTIVTNFLKNVRKPVLLVLDSNHSQNHVLSELNSLAPLLPEDSVIIVADTIIEEMPDNYYENRPWGVKNNPLTAIQLFLEKNTNFVIDTSFSRRSLMGECRDGILVKKTFI